jgi:prevent-host-death family protein
LLAGSELVTLVTMRKISLAEAKAKLSALVDDAEHRRRKTLILRHGKPSAAIVPIDVAIPRATARRSRLSPSEVRSHSSRRSKWAGDAGQ